MRLPDTDDDDLLAAHIQTMLAASTAWNASSASLAFSCSWMPFDVAAKTGPSELGIYAFGLASSINYGQKSSKIIYIGSARSLAKRLKTHRRSPQNKQLALFQEHYRDQLLATYWTFPNSDLRVVRSIEGLLLREFEAEHGFVPLCNMDISVGEFEVYCDKYVSISCQPTKESGLTFEDLGNVFGLNSYRTTKEPGGANLVFTTTPEYYSSFRMVRFLDDEGLRVEKAIVAEKKRRSLMTEVELEEEWRWHEEENRKNQLPYVGAHHLAEWDAQTMAKALAICGTLVREPTRKTKAGARFQAIDRAVPLPITWGEIALLKARLEAGTWQTKSRFWVKVLNGKEVLGQAALNPTFCYGEDVSDLPQRATLRPEVETEDYEYHRQRVYAKLDEVLMTQF